MSAYFASRPTGLFGTPGSTGPAGPTGPTGTPKAAPAKATAKPGFVAAVTPATTKLFGKPAPTKVVQVRAHTRTVPVKATPKSTPVSTPVVTQSVRPAQTSTVKRFAPHFRGEPVAGQVGAFKNADGTWVNPGTKAQPGAYIAERPYWTDANTLRVKAGPAGNEGAQWNAAQVAKAKQIQEANYGKPGYVFRSLIPGGLDEGGTTSVAKALLRGADVASNILPGGGVGEAAGILGWGLKAIRDLRGAKDVAEAAPVVAHVAPVVAAAAEDPGVALAKSKLDAIKQIDAHQFKPDMFHSTKDQLYSDLVSSAGRSIKWDKFPDRRSAVLDYWTRALKSAETRAAKTAPQAAPVTKALTGTTSAAAEPVPAEATPAVKIAEAAPKVAPPAPHTTEGGAAVRGALKGAPNVRAAQAADFSAQRRARFAKAESIYRDTSLTPEERQARALGALKGSLDRPVFTGFKKMTPETVTNIKAQVMEHPTLRTGQKTTLLTSLDRAVGGIVPTAGEHKLFTQVFGKETALGIAQAAKTGRWKNIVANVINVPRTLQSTLDMSAFLRQGAVALARHPVITAGNFKTLVHSFASEGAALKVESDIASHPNYPLMKAGGVSFTGSGDLQPQEEQFGANMLENLGGGKNPIRWSSRSYSAFLNKTRADIFNHLLDVAHTQGQNIHDEKFLKDLGNMVNVFTGRGSLPGDWERAAKVFNGLFFSPRLMASRIQVLGQPFNPALHPFVRRQYQRAFAQTFGALVSVLGLAKLNGLNVGTDPTSADFGKIKFGKTRVDLGAGFLQYAHLAGELLTGKSTSSTSGKVSHIYSGKFAQRSAHDVVSGFFEGKLSPFLAMLDDALRQQTNFGKFNIWQELINHLTPLSSQDIYGVATNRSKGPLGAAEVAGAGALSIFGGGLQTYGPKTPTTTRVPTSSTGYFSNSSGGGGGGGSPYFSGSSSSSSGGSPYFSK